MTNLKLAIMALLITGCATQAMVPSAPRKQPLTAEQKFQNRAADLTFERLLDAVRTGDDNALEKVFTEIHHGQAIFYSEDLGELINSAREHENEWAEAVFEDVARSIEQADQSE